MSNYVSPTRLIRFMLDQYSRSAQVYSKQDIHQQFYFRSTRSADYVLQSDDPPEALNWTTGETVAIKKISLSDIPKAELGDIMVRNNKTEYTAESSSKCCGCLAERD
jgi:hypothetical protein